MENTNDIMTSLRVASQIPLDRKAWCINEDTLKDLGTDNQLAYTYHKGLRVICIENRTTYEWKEIQLGEVGLLDNNFTYPTGWIVDGIDYSSISYNFVLYRGDSISPFIAVDQGNGIGIIIEGRNSNNFGSVGFGGIDFSKSLLAGAYGAKAWYSAIINGERQEITATSEGSIIGAGFRNYINAKFSGILTGTNGIIDGIGGGTSYLILSGLGNTIRENSFIGVSTILNGNLGIINSYYATLLNGDSNTIDENGIYGFIGSGNNNLVSAYQAIILQGSNNTASGVNSTVINGNYSQALGNASVVLNGTNAADSFAEVVAGSFGTTYTPASRTTFNISDRIFNIGVGTSNENKKDGLSLFKNGVLLLPELTIAKINLASDKVVITKEFLNSFVDGSQTKVVNGDNTSKSGTGTSGDPYKINAVIPFANGLGTTVEGDGITTPFKINLSTNVIINEGCFFPLDVGAVAPLSVAGNIVSAVSEIGVTSSDSIVTVTLQNAMPNMKYKVNILLEGLSDNLDDDNDVVTPIFKKISTTQFKIAFRELGNTTQNLKVHIQTIPYSY